MWIMFTKFQGNYIATYFQSLSYNFVIINTHTCLWKPKPICKQQWELLSLWPGVHSTQSEVMNVIVFAAGDGVPHRWWCEEFVVCV